MTLHFTILNSDRYSRDDVMGEVMVEMENLDMKSASVNDLDLVRDIAPRSSKVDL